MPSLSRWPAGCNLARPSGRHSARLCRLRALAYGPPARAIGAAPIAVARQRHAAEFCGVGREMARWEVGGWDGVGGGGGAPAAEAKSPCPIPAEIGLWWRPRASTSRNWAACEERDRRWVPRGPRAAGHRLGCRIGRCAPFTSSSSPVRSTQTIWTPRRCAASSPRAGVRSLATGVDPDRGGAGSPHPSAPSTRCAPRHPLASALPVIRRLLVEDADDAGVVVAVTAADGTLLWVEGDRNALPQGRGDELRARRRLERARRGHQRARVRRWRWTRELQIRGSEHFSRIVQPWSCTAAPVHDPDTGVAARRHRPDRRDSRSPHRRRWRWCAPPPSRSRTTSRCCGCVSRGPRTRRAARALTVLGADRPRWTVTDADGNPHTTTLTGRHADILVLLSRHPKGSERRSPGDAARRQRPRRGDRARRDVAAAPGHRSRVRRVPAVPTAGADRTATSATSSTRSKPATSTPRSAGTPGALLPQSVSPASPGCAPSCPPACAARCSRRASLRCCAVGSICPRAATTATAGAALHDSAARRAGDAGAGQRPSGRPGLRTRLGPLQVATPCNRAATSANPSLVTTDTFVVAKAGETSMTVYARPGAEGSLMSFESRYDNYIGGEWVAPAARPVLREPHPGHRPDVLRGRPLRRGRHRAGARRRARRRTGLGQDLAGRARGDPEQDRRPHRGEPRVHRGRRDLGQRQADPRDAERRHPAGRRPLPLLRRCDPRAGGLAVARSTTTPSPTTSTSRSAWSARSSRGTSRS